MVCTVREISTNFFLACCEARPSRVWRFENVSAGSDDAGYDRTQHDSTTNGSLSKDTQRDQRLALVLRIVTFET